MACKSTDHHCDVENSSPRRNIGWTFSRKGITMRPRILYCILTRNSLKCFKVHGTNRNSSNLLVYFFSLPDEMLVRRRVPIPSPPARKLLATVYTQVSKGTVRVQSSQSNDSCRGRIEDPVNVNYKFQIILGEREPFMRIWCFLDFNSLLGYFPSRWLVSFSYQCT